jgi:hypothetical protein
VPANIWSRHLQAGIHLPFDDPTFTATAAADMVAEEAAAAADDRPRLRELSPYSQRTEELQGAWEVSLARRSCEVVRLLHWLDGSALQQGCSRPVYNMHASHVNLLLKQRLPGLSLVPCL